MHLKFSVAAGAGHGRPLWSVFTDQFAEPEGGNLIYTIDNWFKNNEKYLGFPGIERHRL